MLSVAMAADLTQFLEILQVCNNHNLGNNKIKSVGMTNKQYNGHFTNKLQNIHER